ncbi:hypothetical protein OSB04_006808 [Centaurea solstitialis]|uniref:Reverse transcriptase Ty1/copia-type domain-containing protein n=1 Tax=Centaurea solstitialis TaxID=347529 RepID=A0AA38TR97_9ASTR|nr:hypothetical protein OSB04_006808 [Centaurea solstitialis]
MHQPPRFEDPSKPNHVCLLQRSLNGLKQTPRAWFHRFSMLISRMGFVHSRCDASLFIYRHGSHSSSTTLISQSMVTLSTKFSMSDLGDLHYFLGSLSVSTKVCQRDPRTYWHVNCIANWLPHLLTSTPNSTAPVPEFRIPHPIAALLGLSSILLLLARILLMLQPCGMFVAPLTPDLITYSYADCARFPTTRRSTSGYCMFLGHNLLSWSSKRQGTTSRSSAEAEYHGVANAVAETCWICNLLRELHHSPQNATVVYCDNVSAVYLTFILVQHQRKKHIEIDIHFVREKVALGHIWVLHVPSSAQYADIFTKSLPSPLFLDFRFSLNVRCPPVLTAGGC